MQWQDIDKPLLLVFQDQIGLSWEAITGTFVSGTLAGEYRTGYEISRRRFEGTNTYWSETMERDIGWVTR